MQCVVRPDTASESENGVQLAGQAGRDPDGPVANHRFLCLTRHCTLFALFSRRPRSKNASYWEAPILPVCVSLPLFVSICIEMLVFFAVLCSVPARARASRPSFSCLQILLTRSNSPPMDPDVWEKLQRGAAVLWRPLGFQRVCHILRTRASIRPPNLIVPSSRIGSPPTVSPSFGGRAFGCGLRFYWPARCYLHKRREMKDDCSVGGWVRAIPGSLFLIWAPESDWVRSSPLFD